MLKMIWKGDVQMASELLTKIRRLNKIIQKTGAEPVVLDRKSVV
mgnify:CR=1 FL=1